MTKIIVELCQNHLGNRELLSRMIDAAANSGADYVKIQSIFSEDLTQRQRFEEGETHPDGRIKTLKRPYQPELERLSVLDLSLDDHNWFIEKCAEAGVKPLTTIFARHRIPEIAALPWPEKTVKVASYDCAIHPFLKELARHFDHLIISTGATYDEEIQKTTELMKSLGKKFAFLHCVTSYPNTLETCHLNRMMWLKNLAPEVGWSDHTKVVTDGIAAAKIAIMLGANFVERHFTILPSDQTKDGPVSITPALLKELDEFRKKPPQEQRKNLDSLHPNWQIALGRETRPISEEELLNRDYYRGRFASKSGDKWIYNWEE